jgi:hypothetical protein
VTAGVAAPDRTFEITWVPGTDTMLGRCHCGAERRAEEPIELWTWLLGHPSGHGPQDSGGRP